MNVMLVKNFFYLLSIKHLSKMGLLQRVTTSPAKEELTELLVTGEDDESFEVIRDYISKEGGRKLVKNTGMTLAFLPFLLVGLLFVVIAFIILISPDSEVPIWGSLCSFSLGSVAMYVGWELVSESVGEVINPDDYEKSEVKVFFHDDYQYLAEVKVILDATDEDKIGDIIFLKQIFLSDECEIECEFDPGYTDNHSGRPESNTFYVSDGNKNGTCITIFYRGYLKEAKRIEIAERFSKKLGIRIADPLVV